MAMESPVLLEALIAFSAANLSFFDKSHEIFALETRSKALASLSASLRRANAQEQEANLATCLVLSSTEASLGDRTAWYKHLQGAKQIILSARQNHQAAVGLDVFKGNSEGRWLLRNFAYHDIMGSIMSGSGLLLDPEYLPDVAATVDSYFGVASEILRLTAHISSLDFRPSNIHPAEEAQRVEISVDMHHSVSSIEKNLKDWECPRDTDTVLASVAHAYRHAALLYLYNRLRNSQLSNAFNIARPLGISQTTQIEVERTLYHVSSVPLNDSPEASLLFPLFMAGISTNRSSEINAVRRRMDLVRQKRGFQNAGLALQILERVWALTESQVGELWGGLDWQSILEIGGGGLNLC